MPKYDALIVGAGFAGAVAARQLAQAGRYVVLLEQRDHIGGNAYDCCDTAGVLIHRYGPHIFHTNDAGVFAYLSRFTKWRDYAHRVEASIPNGHGGRLTFPVPFNLDSLECAFGRSEGSRLGRKLIAAYGAENKVPILRLLEQDDPELIRVADYIYQNVFLSYTRKQWGCAPEEIDPAAMSRVPVFLSRDNRYFQDRFQGIPEQGYTRLFEALLDHPRIEVRLHTPADTVLDVSGSEMQAEGHPFEGPVIYTGALDELFGCVYGRLPYRSLRFRFETHSAERLLPCATVNYTADETFTRITEFKQLTGQHIPGVTTLAKEYPCAYTAAPEEIPYYAVLCDASRALYQRYRTLAARYPNLHLLGRLAEYQYYNMDAVTARALLLSRQLTGLQD